MERVVTVRAKPGGEARRQIFVDEKPHSAATGAASIAAAA
jgi:hypothetical protein